MDSIELLPGIYESDMPLSQRLDHVSMLMKMHLWSSSKKPRHLTDFIYIERFRIYSLTYTDILGLPGEPSIFDEKERLDYNSTWVEYNIGECNFIVTLIYDYARETILPSFVDVVIDLILYFNDSINIWNDKINILNDNTRSIPGSHTPILDNLEEITPSFIDTIINNWDASSELPKCVSIKRLGTLKNILRMNTINNIIK